MSVAMISSVLASTDSNGSLLTCSSPTNTTFQASFPLPHVPDMNFSQANEMPMTSFPTFMNGAYSHEPKQINLLQERAKLLDGQVMKLTIENNALRTAFQCLASAIGLRDVDPCQFDSKSFAQISAPPKSKAEPVPPTPSDYPSVRFWDREDWDKYLESPDGQTSQRGTMGYLEDRDGNPPSYKTAKAIRKVLRGGWVELVNRELTPPTWGRLSASGRQFIHSLMESAFPDFKFANNGWKVDYLPSTTYPAWRKGMLDDNGKWKQKKGKVPKIEDDNDGESMDDVGTKRKAFAFKSEAGPGKRFKGEHREEGDLTPSTSTTSLSPPLSDSSTTSFEPTTGALPSAMRASSIDTAHDSESLSPFADALCDHEKETVQQDANTTNVMSIDPLAALALAASKARDILRLPLLDATQELPSSSMDPNNVASNTMPILELESAILPAATPMLSTMPAVVDDAMLASVNKSAKGSKAKMRPGPAKNGRNLCAHRWRKQAQLSGSTEEFQKYYNGLTSTQRKAYDDEAAVLATSNNWDTKTICNGTLH
ncbi:hypothetical protein EDD16DRAFT_1852261 [Pisolithus croceorrhizus]|nr:hypothetical protein EDD16DRAFT_1852261 [Pisolithus croceorrhizus]